MGMVKNSSFIFSVAYFKAPPYCDSDFLERITKIHFTKDLVTASSYTRGQASRTFTSSNHGADGRDAGYQREEVPPQRNAGYSPRALDNGTFYDARGGYVPRGGFAGRGRGGYSPRGDAFPSRGFTGPKRYSEQRGEIIPTAPIVPIPPPQHNFSIPRQPTDVVYFDPTQQVRLKRLRVFFFISCSKILGMRQYYGRVLLLMLALLSILSSVGSEEWNIYVFRPGFLVGRNSHL
ncbi:hypothetical protein ANCCAN_00797 [Ancylostoma caninum]|uniref:Uncharacterized protein n=1 Tax=Ancylostoma caninum TaxID=29170 RepID=A0A368HC11_ANCCA|nr:hypothetical protein ANCCAN_00797 [Ancylostoma caninum]